MTQSQSRITLGNLPPRARQLKASEMTAVFGGCVSSYGACDAKNASCCPGLVCRPLGGSSSSLGAMTTMGTVYCV